MFTWSRVFSLFSLSLSIAAAFHRIPTSSLLATQVNNFFPGLPSSPVEFRDAAHETQTDHSELCCHVFSCYWTLKPTPLWRCQDIKLLYIPKKSSEAMCGLWVRVNHQLGLIVPELQEPPKAPGYPFVNVFVRECILGISSTKAHYETQNEHKVVQMSPVFVQDLEAPSSSWSMCQSLVLQPFVSLQGSFMNISWALSAGGFCSVVKFPFCFERTWKISLQFPFWNVFLAPVSLRSPLLNSQSALIGQLTHVWAGTANINRAALLNQLLCQTSS